jgi:homocysteine S-methyltransferase
LEDYVDEWVKLGAGFIGGCCRTGADDIEKIKNKVVALGLD